MNFKRFGEYKVTSLLLIINIGVFIMMTLSGGSESTYNLIRFGAMAKPLVYEGGWRRILTASFIHIGLFHLLFNMYFLYNIGPIFERLYGPGKFLIIYLLAGLIGNLFTYGFGSNTTISAGASTSLYGIFGLAIGIMLNYRDDPVLRGIGASLLSTIAINIIYSLVAPGIGILGHLGGFVGGIILSGIFPVRARSLSSITVIISVLALIILAYLFVRIGNSSLKVGV